MPGSTVSGWGWADGGWGKGDGMQMMEWTKGMVSFQLPDFVACLMLGEDGTEMGCCGSGERPLVGHTYMSILLDRRRMEGGKGSRVCWRWGHGEVDFLLLELEQQLLEV